MKRRISLILAMTMIATSLLACGKEEDKETEVVTEEEQAETVEEEEQTGEETVDSTPEYAYTSVEYDNDYEYFSGKIQCVEITDQIFTNLAEAVNTYFSDQVKNFNKTCESMVEDAKKTNESLAQDKTENEGAENEYVYDYTAYYEYDISVEVTRCDNKLFSIKIDEYSFEGGANGTENEYGVTFDSQTGEILENTLFDDYADIIKDEILTEIETSSDEFKEQLFTDYKDEVERISTSGLAIVGVWFNERGIVIAFPEVSIAPHSAGTITFNIPYSKLEGFDTNYLPDGEFYTADISSMGLADLIDVNGDGVEEVVYLESSEDEDEYYYTYILHVGEDEIKLEDYEMWSCSPMFVHSSTGNYIIMQTLGLSDYNTFYMYNVNKNYALIQTMAGHIDDITDGQAQISNTVYAFGTWTAVKNYSYDGNGFDTTETVDRFNNDPRTNPDAIGITLLKKLEYTTSDGETETLSKGTVIYPQTNDGEKLEFINEDGSIQGYFTYTYADGIRFVNGVSEYDLFEGMPYAG